MRSTVSFPLALFLSLSPSLSLSPYPTVPVLIFVINRLPERTINADTLEHLLSRRQTIGRSRILIKTTKHIYDTDRLNIRLRVVISDFAHVAE